MNVLKQKRNLVLGKKLSLGNVEEFSWEEAIGELSTAAPVLTKLVSASATVNRDAASLTRGKKNIQPAVGMIHAILLHLRSPKRFRFIQDLISVELWRGGCKRKVCHHVSFFSRVIIMCTNLNLNIYNQHLGQTDLYYSIEKNYLQQLALILI